LCRKPKPHFTHHCNVCGRCQMRMDHHCPWMANCVGHYNYRYFFNFLFWLWLGCIYAATMAIPPTKPTLRLMKRDMRTSILFTFVLSCAICVALSILMGWHIYLVTSGQTTIQFYSNQAQRREEKSKGGAWVNKFNLGASFNWQEVFDERGRFWWIRWMLPRLRPHSMNGIFWPTIFNIEEHRESLMQTNARTLSQSPKNTWLLQKASLNEDETGKEIVWVIILFYPFRIFTYSYWSNWDLWWTSQIFGIRFMTSPNILLMLHILKISSFVDIVNNYCLCETSWKLVKRTLGWKM